MYGPIGFGHGALAVLNAIVGVIGSVILFGLIVAVLFFLIRFLIVGTKAAQLYLDTPRRTADAAIPAPGPTPTSTATVATVPTMPTVVMPTTPTMPTVVIPTTPPATNPATPVKPVVKPRTPRTPPTPNP